MKRMHAVFFGMVALSAGAASAADNSASGVSQSRIVAESPRDFPDVSIAGNRTISEQSSSVAAHPSDPKRLLAAISRGYPRDDCVTRASVDGGKTWALAVKLPVPAGHICSHPVVVYSPDGSRAYAAYARSLPADCYSEKCANDILFSTSVDGGKTWSAPNIAIDGAGNDPFTRAPALATPSTKRDAKNVYLLASNSFGMAGQYSQIVFSQSGDGGKTWRKPREIANFDYMTGGAIGYGVAGGSGGELLLTWDYYDYTGIERIIARRSRNFGRTFDSPVAAAEEVHRTTHDPDVKVGSGGVAYIVYAAYDSATAQSSIRYIYSNGAPYKAWSAPVTLSGSERLSYAPALAVENCGRANLLHVTWLDDRMNVSYTRKITGSGYAWSKTIRISNASSPVLDQPAFSDLAAGGRNAFAIWTDRRPITDPGNYATNVYGSRITSGVDCGAGSS